MPDLVTNLSSEAGVFMPSEAWEEDEVQQEQQILPPPPLPSRKFMLVLDNRLGEATCLQTCVWALEHVKSRQQLFSVEDLLIVLLQHDRPPTSLMGMFDGEIMAAKVRKEADRTTQLARRVRDLCKEQNVKFKYKGGQGNANKVLKSYIRETAVDEILLCARHRSGSRIKKSVADYCKHKFPERAFCLFEYQSLGYMLPCLCTLYGPIFQAHVPRACASHVRSEVCSVAVHNTSGWSACGRRRLHIHGPVNVGEMADEQRECLRQ
jgi:hypothetical protein